MLGGQRARNRTRRGGEWNDRESEGKKDVKGDTGEKGKRGGSTQGRKKGGEGV